MRIAIFTNTYWPTVNGVAISIANLKRGLQDAGHQVHIFAPTCPDFDLRGDEPGVIRFPSVPAPVEADYHLAMPYSRPVLKALRRLDFDLVHTQHPLWVGSWGRWYARWAGKPLVTTIHTQYETYSNLIPLPDALVEAYVRARVTAYCNKCDVVTTPAASARERLRAQGVTSPIEVVYNPTDLSACFQADGRAIRHQVGCTGPEDFLLGYVGRLAREKGLSVLIEAAVTVLAHYPRARLLIIGDGPSRVKTEKQVASLPCADRIHFAGRVPHARIPEYQAALDLFVTASVMEVQPLSFAEAFATGTPLVTFDVSGNNDMVEDGVTGRLVPVAAGAAGLAEAMLQILGDPVEMARLQANARERSQLYDQPQVVQRMLQVYAQAQELARQRAAPEDLED